MDQEPPAIPAPGATPGRWAALRIERIEAAGMRVAARVRVPPETALVGGHFPGDPILPGFTLLALVADLAGANGFRNVRFRVPLRPGDQFELLVAADGRFTIQSGARAVATGVLGGSA